MNLAAVCLIIGGIVGAVSDSKIGFALVAVAGVLMLVGSRL